MPHCSLTLSMMLMTFQGETDGLAACLVQDCCLHILYFIVQPFCGFSFFNLLCFSIGVCNDCFARLCKVIDCDKEPFSSATTPLFFIFARMVSDMTTISLSRFFKMMPDCSSTVGLAGLRISFGWPVRKYLAEEST